MGDAPEPSAHSPLRPLRVVFCLRPETVARLQATLSELAVQAVTALDLDALREALASGAELVIAGDEGELVGLAVCSALDAVRSLGKEVGVVGWAGANASSVTRLFARGAVDVIGEGDLARLPWVIRREVERVRKAASAHLYEQVVDSLPSLLFVKDAADRRLVVANQTFASVFGVTKEWLIGKKAEDFFPRDQAAAFNSADDEVLAAKELRVVEEVVRIGAEDYIYRTSRYALLDEKGESAFLVGVTDDVSSVRRAEDDLRRSQEVTQKTLASYQRRALEMEVIRQQNEDLDRLAADLARAKRVEEDRSKELELAARLKSDLLANFSHEIRTPLTGILGYCDLLLREEGDSLSPSALRDLTGIKQNARTLVALINDILDLAKLEAGRSEVLLQRLDVEELVVECCSMVRELLRGPDVKLAARVDPRARFAMTDPLRLKQILLNLLSNSAKFTDVGAINVTITTEGETLIVSVEDSGAGIPADQIPFIFDKFRQVDGMRARHGGGTGLGLAIVREVANLLGGTVDVRSVLGRGSTFVVKLPRTTLLAQSAADAPEPTPTPSPPPEPLLASGGRRAHVLYIEDSAQNRDIMRRYLAPHFDVTEADDGDVGVVRAEEERPDLILMDLSLPRVDGWEATRRIKAIPALAHIPIIAVSAHVGPEQKARATELGCVEYLSKPIDRAALFAAIARQLPRDSAVPKESG